MLSRTFPPSTFFGEQFPPNTLIMANLRLPVQLCIVRDILYCYFIHDPKFVYKDSYNLHAIHELMILNMSVLLLGPKNLRPTTNADKFFRPFPNCTNFPKLFVFFVSNCYVMDTWACIYKNLIAMQILNKLLNHVFDIYNDLYSFIKQTRFIIAIIIVIMKGISIHFLKSNLQKQATVRLNLIVNVFNIIWVKCQASV